MPEPRLESTGSTPPDPDPTPRGIFSTADYFRLTYDGRRLRCYVRLLNPAHLAGTPPTREQLEEAIVADCTKRGIVKPDRKAIQTAVAAEEYGDDFLIAEGRDPVPGRDGVVTYKFRTDLETIQLVEDADGRVDFRELGLIQNVKPKQVLAVATKPTAGRPGIDVFGKPVRAVGGQAARIRCGDNVRVSEDRLTATSNIDGYVRLDNMVLSIKPVYLVSGDVDFGVGNVKFNGTVRVVGSVLEDFVINAHGDVLIDGDVEKAHIVAGGNVYIKGSIFGKEGAEVRAGKDIMARMGINATLLAGGDIVVGEELNNTHAEAGGGVRLDGTHRRLVGGTTIAHTEVRAAVIGSETGLAKTRIELRVRPGILEQAEELENRRIEIDGQCTKREGSLAKMLALKEKMGQLSGDQFRNVRVLMEEIQALRDEQSDCLREAGELRQTHSSQEAAMVVVEDVCYPGTTLVLHELETHIEKQQRRCIFARHGDTIAWEAL